MKRIIAIVLALVMALGMLTACGSATTTPAANNTDAASGSNPITIKLGHAQTTDSIWQQQCEFIKEYVESRDSSITIDIYPDCQLGSESTMMQAALAGTLDMVGLTYSELSNMVPACQVCELPFFYGTIDNYVSVQKDETFRNTLWGYIEEKGLVPIGMSDLAGRSLGNTKRDVHTPDDVAGLKIRVMTSPIYTEIWSALGANPVSLAFNEVYTGLQQGLIDGEETGLETMVNMGFNEIEKHHTELFYVICGGANLFSAATWAKLTPEQQALFKEAGVAAEDYAVGLFDDYYNERKETAIASGVSVVTPTEDELAAFEEKVQPVITSLVEKDSTISDLYTIACNILGK